MRALGFVTLVVASLGLWMVPAGNPAVVGALGFAK